MWLPDRAYTLNTHPHSHLHTDTFFCTLLPTDALPTSYFLT